MMELQYYGEIDKEVYLLNWEYDLHACEFTEMLYFACLIRFMYKSFGEYKILLCVI